MKKIILAIGLVAVALTGTACSKSKGGGGAVLTTYYKSEGTCYERSTNKEVDDKKCDGILYYFSSAGTCRLSSDDSKTALANCEAMVNRYFYADGVCYDKDEDQKVDDSKCKDDDDDNNDDNNDDDDDDNNSDIPRITCTGLHIDADTYYYYGEIKRYNCDKNYERNCKGYYMYDNETGKLVYCK